jgi:hypothetical protein
MLSSTTPFKLYDDENNASIATKKSVGLAPQSNNIKENTTMFASSFKTPGNKPKSTRKALGVLSTNQTHTKTRIPVDTLNKNSLQVHQQQGPFDEKTTTISKKRTSSKSFNRGKLDVEKMLCSNISKEEEDTYDKVMNATASAESNIPYNVLLPMGPIAPPPYVESYSHENCNFDWQMEDTQSDLEALSLVDYTDTHRSPEYGCPELGLDVELDLGLDVELDI